MTHRLVSAMAPIAGHAFCNSLYDVEIRKVLCSTNAIESLNARYRRAVRARGTSRPSSQR